MAPASGDRTDWRRLYRRIRPPARPNSSSRYGCGAPAIPLYRGILATGTSNIRAPAATQRLGRKGEQQRIDPRTLRPLARLVPFILRYRWRVIATLVFLLVAALTSLLIPLFAGKVVDKGFLAQNLGMVAN